MGAVVVDAQFHGHDTLVDLVVDDAGRQALLARVPGDLVLTPGQPVWVEVVGLGPGVVARRRCRGSRPPVGHDEAVEPPASERDFGDPTRRTYLAQERTLLAWWRTAFAAMRGGAGGRPRLVRPDAAAGGGACHPSARRISPREPAVADGGDAFLVALMVATIAVMFIHS